LHFLNIGQSMPADFTQCCATPAKHLLFAETAHRRRWHISANDDVYSHAGRISGVEPCRSAKWPLFPVRQSLL
jgi:hypothetical protein